MKICKLLLAMLLVAAVTVARAADPVPPGTAKHQGGKLVVTFVALQTHGTATLVQTPGGKAYLVDAGLSDETYNAGRDTIAPLLAADGIKELAGMVISHPHGDHYGGAPWLLEHVPVKRFVDHGYEGRGQTDEYRAIRAQARRRGAHYATAHSGERLDWDPALQVEVLSPPREFINLDADPAKVSEHSILNNNSLVLRIQHGENVFLLPGDVYGAEWSYLIKHWPAEKVLARVLAAPHHGYNATPAYARLIHPEVVVASCKAAYGDSNTSSPADNARQVFEPVGAKVYATPWHGSVRVVSDGRTIDITTERTPAGAKPALK